MEDHLIDHNIHIERREFAGNVQYRAACACPFRSMFTSDYSRAGDDGRIHIKAMRQKQPAKEKKR